MKTMTMQRTGAANVSRPRLVKAADRAAEAQARRQKARDLRAKSELSLNAILNRATGRRPENSKALFDSLFKAAEQ